MFVFVDKKYPYVHDRQYLSLRQVWHGVTHAIHDILVNKP